MSLQNIFLNYLGLHYEPLLFEMTFKKIIHLYGIQMKNLYGDKLGRAAKQFEIQQVVQKESHEAV